MFNVLRDEGTATRCASNLSVNWERPFQGSSSAIFWKITLHGDSAAYNASQFNEQPNFGLRHNIDTATAQPGVAVDFSWPFMRDSGSWGTQLIEPKLQLVLQPREQATVSFSEGAGNEDSLSFEFSDANLFGFNRFSGIDRLEGNSRINAALHSAWYFGTGTLLDGLIGQSYPGRRGQYVPGLLGVATTRVSDIVARATLSPTQVASM